MTKYISTQPIRGANGRPLKGKAAVKARREQHRTRQKCRICKGTHQMQDRLLGEGYLEECDFCDEDGYAKYQCDDCGEALPMCKCVRSSRYAEAGA